jgi:uncharacterized phage protein gp47/JayE
MYRDQIKDVILERMLARVPTKFDKREGSLIWDSLAPAAVEFQNFFYALAAVLDEVFPDTATRKYLIKHCADNGIKPYPASAAIVQGEFTPDTVEIPIGERFSHEDLNYYVKEKISDGIYKLECETKGAIGNDHTGRLTPIANVPGLQTANIVDILIPGEDEEDTESLRARYFDSFQSESFGGNKKDYRDKILSIPGVGGCKVYSGSEWNGGGTVKCVIQNSEYGEPSDEFISDIQTKIDPEVNSGEGQGLAPIGHFVTVLPVNIETIDFEFGLKYRAGYSWESVEHNVENAVKEYVSGLNKRWQNSDRIIVRAAHIESSLLDIAGILDIEYTKINGLEANYYADRDSIIKEGSINGH